MSPAVPPASPLVLLSAAPAAAAVSSAVPLAPSRFGRAAVVASHQYDGAGRRSVTGPQGKGDVTYVSLRASGWVGARGVRVRPSDVRVSLGLFDSAEAGRQ
ncbi:hypothetical protein GCM10010524_18430 [Streptomyces mexicanus]